MKWEFWSELDLYRSAEKKQIIDHFVGQQPQSPDSRLESIQDAGARRQLLAQLSATEEVLTVRDSRGREREVAAKDYVRTGALQYGKPSGLLFWYYGADDGRVDTCQAKGIFQGFLSERLQWMQGLLGPVGSGISVALPNLSHFPPGSWTLGFTFRLKKPYLSKDDAAFDVLDNPVRKEWVFQVPYVAPSQWKGALRAAMRRLRGCTSWRQEAKDEQMVRLFGNIKGEESEFSAGWLHFYPTFFDKIGLEVINPHPRDTGAGKQPIYFECVPPGTEGTFTLLYVPLEEVDEAKAKEDFRVVAEGLKAMFTKYGFGAKTSSGFGRAHVRWKKEEGAEVQPESWREEWERIWREEEFHE